MLLSFQHAHKETKTVDTGLPAVVNNAKILGKHSKTVVHLASLISVPSTRQIFFILECTYCIPNGKDPIEIKDVEEPDLSQSNCQRIMRKHIIEHPEFQNLCKDFRDLLQEHKDKALGEK